MTKGHKRYCKNKAAYVSEYAAQAAEREAIKRTGEDIHYYFCDGCGNFHLGHRTRRKGVKL